MRPPSTGWQHMTCDKHNSIIIQRIHDHRRHLSCNRWRQRSVGKDCHRNGNDSNTAVSSNKCMPKGELTEGISRSQWLGKVLSQFAVHFRLYGKDDWRTFYQICLLNLLLNIIIIIIITIVVILMMTCTTIWWSIYRSTCVCWQPSSDLHSLVAAKFYCPHPRWWQLAYSIQKKIPELSPQWCNLHHLHTYWHVYIKSNHTIE